MAYLKGAWLHSLPRQQFFKGFLNFFILCMYFLKAPLLHLFASFNSWGGGGGFTSTTAVAKSLCNESWLTCVACSLLL